MQFRPTQGAHQSFDSTLLTMGKIIPWLCVLAALSCLLIQVFVSNRFAAAGRHISETDTKIKQLAQENSLLQEQIASASAILMIKQNAESLGFVRATTPLFLVLDQPVAVGLK